MKNLYEQTEKTEDSNSVLNPDNLNTMVTKALVTASRSNDTKTRLVAALSGAPVSAIQVGNALLPPRPAGSRSTTPPKQPKPPKGTTGTGSKPEEVNPVNPKINEAPSGPATKIGAKLASVTGLGAVTKTVTNPSDAHQSLVGFAGTFVPNTKKKASDLLSNAAALAKKKEANIEIPVPLKEFISYLFEETGSQSNKTYKISNLIIGIKPNQNNSTVNETIYNKGKIMRKKMSETEVRSVIREEIKRNYSHLSIKEQRLLEEGLWDDIKTGAAKLVGSAGKAIGGAATKAAEKISKIPGLDKILATVKNMGDASTILFNLATGLGGEKTSAVVLLTKAMTLAKQEEQNKPKDEASPPGAAPPGAAPIKEFVSYLFEGTER
jgi:hypothetical protein